MHRKQEEEEQQQQQEKNHPKQPAELEGTRGQECLRLLSREQVEEEKSLKPTKWLKL